MKIVFIFILFVFPSAVKSQISSQELQSLLSSPDHLKNAGITEINDVQQFYGLNGYKPVWLCSDGSIFYKELSQMIRNARYQGLNPCDYSAALLSDEDVCLEMIENKDSLIVEARITDAAIRFFSDMARGSIRPVFSYDGLAYSPPSGNIPRCLFTARYQNSLKALADSLNAVMPQIKPVLAEIGTYLNAVQRQGYKEEKIISAKADVSNRPLCRKLFALGCTDSLLTTAKALLSGMR